eukprot:SAG22_NODE_14340_length_377_cov_0.723022_1_plen_65_part_10
MAVAAGANSNGTKSADDRGQHELTVDAERCAMVQRWGRLGSHGSYCRQWSLCRTVAMARPGESTQ